MADLLCTRDYIPISFIGCGMTRCALLALEPSSRVWLEIEGEPLLFERMPDGPDGSISRFETSGIKRGSLAADLPRLFRLGN